MAPSWILFCSMMSPASIHEQHSGGWEPSPRRSCTLLTGCLTTGVIAFHFLNIWWQADLAGAEASAEPLGKKRKNTSCSLPRCFRCKVGHRQTQTQWLKPSQASRANQDNEPPVTELSTNNREESKCTRLLMVSLLIMHEPEILLLKGWKLQVLLITTSSASNPKLLKPLRGFAGKEHAQLTLLFTQSTSESTQHT